MSATVTSFWKSMKVVLGSAPSGGFRASAVLRAPPANGSPARGGSAFGSENANCLAAVRPASQPWARTASRSSRSSADPAVVWFWRDSSGRKAPVSGSQARVPPACMCKCATGENPPETATRSQGNLIPSPFPHTSTPLTPSLPPHARVMPPSNRTGNRPWAACTTAVSPAGLLSTIAMTSAPASARAKAVR